MLGISDLDDFTPNSSEPKYDRIELEVFNKTLKLYLVNNGTRTMINDNICDINYNDINEISYRFDYSADTSVLLLKVNGKDYELNVPKTVDGDRFGFYSKNNTVTIY